jgi:chemotaxis protein CheX
MNEGGTMTTTYVLEIEQVVQSVFSTMLNIDLARVEDTGPADGESLISTIQISGQWVGSIVLGLSPTLSRAAVAAMLQISLAEVTEVDQQDVAAELVNMIGGNLKGLLPGPSSLSLPMIVSGRDFDVRVSGAELIDDVLLGNDTGFLRVRIYTTAVPA